MINPCWSIRKFYPRRRIRGYSVCTSQIWKKLNRGHASMFSRDRSRWYGYNRVTNGENYKLFTSPIPRIPQRKLLIANEEKLIEHLGNYPVIYVNFKSASIHSLDDDAINEYTAIVHNAFRKHICIRVHHSMLRREKYAKMVFWSQIVWLLGHPPWSRMLGTIIIVQTFQLEVLRYCWWIYDSLCLSAMFRVEERVLEHIIDFFISCLDNCCLNVEQIPSELLSETKQPMPESVD